MMTTTGHYYQSDWASRASVAVDHPAHRHRRSHFHCRMRPPTYDRRHLVRDLLRTIVAGAPETGSESRAVARK